MNNPQYQLQPQQQYISCPRCYAWNYPNASICHHCGAPLNSQVINQQMYNYPQQYYYQQYQQQDNSGFMSVINTYIQYGYHVVSQTQTSAQLTKPKHFSGCLAVFLLFLGIVPLVLYGIYYLAKSDQQVYITLQPDNQITFTNKKGGIVIPDNPQRYVIDVEAKNEKRNTIIFVILLLVAILYVIQFFATIIGFLF